jgi:hypothetical protein
MAKMKTNQDGGSFSAKDSKAPAKELAANQKGAAKYAHHKGAADYNVKKGSHDHPHGASRMGYNQSFGAARVSGYSKGAAKVADIMTFGASKYMTHGAADAGHGGSAGHKHDPVSGSSANFSADDETGAKLTQSVTTKSNVPTPKPTGERTSGSPEFSKAFGKARKSGVSTFDFNGKSYNTNLASDEKPKVTPPATTNTTNTLDENQTSKNQIKRDGLSKKQSLVGQLNMQRYADEMQAVKDSSAVNNKTFKSLLSANSSNLTPQTLSSIERHSANQGNLAANQTRTSSGIPTVTRTAGTHDQRGGSIQRGDSDVPVNQYWTIGGKVDDSRTVMLPNQRSTFKRKAPLYIPIPK